jgi:thymidylate synthase (FAD)
VDRPGGYLDLVEVWGSEEQIVDAARMSVNGGFVSWDPYCKVCKRSKNEPCTNDDRPHEMRSGDGKLLQYLYRQGHSSPFEMAGLTIEIKCPLFVVSQWHRHRTMSYNQHSARYSPMALEFYLPTTERLMRQGKSKQTKGSKALSEAHAIQFRTELRESFRNSADTYREALASGVPREIARGILPVNTFTKFRASANLRNWLHFLGQRMDEHAQEEIREYALTVDKIVALHFPRTWEMFQEQRRLGSIKKQLKDLLKRDPLDVEQGILDLLARM